MVDAAAEVPSYAVAVGHFRRGGTCRRRGGGAELVDRVMRRRRKELSAIVAATGEVWHPAVAPALRAFAEAAGDVPEQDWWLGWPAEAEVA